jgi:hypothetical protein
VVESSSLLSTAWSAPTGCVLPLGWFPPSGPSTPLVPLRIPVSFASPVLVASLAGMERCLGVLRSFDQGRRELSDGQSMGAIDPFGFVWIIGLKVARHELRLAPRHLAADERRANERKPSQAPRDGAGVLPEPRPALNALLVVVGHRCEAELVKPTRLGEPKRPFPEPEPKRCLAAPQANQVGVHRRDLIEHHPHRERTACNSTGPMSRYISSDGVIHFH